MASVGRLSEIAFKGRALAAPMIQIVRYNKKPRWLPIAKSKEFYVREPTPIDPDEYAELKFRYPFYRSAVQSIRDYLKSELTEDKVKTSVQNVNEMADFLWMKEQTEGWNQRIAIQRENRQTEETKAEQERLQQRMKELEQRKLDEALEAEKRVEDLKNISKDIITEENLDLEIEKMLDSRSDYNYAITRDGRIMEGEYPGNS